VLQTLIYVIGIFSGPFNIRLHLKNNLVRVALTVCSKHNQYRIIAAIILVNVLNETKINLSVILFVLAVSI